MAPRRSPGRRRSTTPARRRSTTALAPSGRSGWTTIFRSPEPGDDDLGRAARMKLVKPGAEHEVPRGIMGGSEISQATAGATNIYMARFRVPAGAPPRPPHPPNPEGGLYNLEGWSPIPPGG